MNYEEKRLRIVTWTLIIALVLSVLGVSLAVAFAHKPVQQPTAVDVGQRISKSNAYSTNLTNADVWDGTYTTDWTGAGTQSNPYLISKASQLAGMSLQSYANGQNYAGKYFKLTRDIDMAGNQLNIDAADSYSRMYFNADVLSTTYSSRTWTKMSNNRWYTQSNGYLYESSDNPITASAFGHTFDSSTLNYGAYYLPLDDSETYSVGDTINFDNYVEGLTGTVTSIREISGNSAYYQYRVMYLQETEYDDAGEVTDRHSLSLNLYFDISEDALSDDDAADIWDGTASEGTYYHVSLSYKDLTWLKVEAYHLNFFGIKDFQGNFDGNGHTIGNLHSTDETNTYIEGTGFGLFLNVAAKTNNVVIKDLSITNRKYVVKRGLAIDLNVGSLASTITVSSGYKALIENITTYDSSIKYSDTYSSQIHKMGFIVAQATGNVEITNCHSVDNDITSANYRTIFGGIVGEISGGVKVTQCTSNVSVKVSGQSSTTYGTYASVGGIVGLIVYNSTATGTCTVSDCYSTATISGTLYYNVHPVGGVVGGIQRSSGTTTVVSLNSVVTNNLFQGKISITFGGTVKTFTCIGGILGLSYDSSAKISNNISNATITSSYYGGVVSTAQSNTYSNNAYNTSKTATLGNTATAVQSHGATSDANMKNSSTFSSWTDFANHWVMQGNVNDGYPMLKCFLEIAKVTGFDGAGTSASPYLIKTHQNLMGMASYYNDNALTEPDVYWKLVNNLDMSKDAKNILTHFVPIAHSVEFTGYFDGNGKTISGLLIDNQYKYTGLFGTIASNHYVKNLTVKGNIYWDQAYAVGGVAGRVLAGGYVQNCNFEGKIIGVLNTKSSTECNGVVGIYTIGGAIDCSATYADLKYAKIGGTSTSPTYTYYLYDWARITTKLYNKAV